MELKAIKGIGPTRLEALRAMGISSLRDLLYMMPVRYEDRTSPIPCGEVVPGEALIRGIIQDPPKLSRFNGITRVTAGIRDDTGRLSLVWYNQPWMMQQLPVGTPIMLYGRLTEKNGRRLFQNGQLVQTPEILPVYRAVKGIPAKVMRDMLRIALEQVDDCCPETLPRPLRLRYGLCELNYAIREAHFPEDFDALRLARRRIAFEEMLMFQACLGLERNRQEHGIPFPLTADAPDRYWEHMPFPPTRAQRRVLEEIAADMRLDRPMSRLVQGDVGCGKTALAFGAVAMACQSGYQAAMMAPTEILARQHYLSAKAMLEPMGISCGLLIGSMKASEKKAIHQQLVDGSLQAVFGTHALISKGVEYRQLGLVITDEQHRFGVRQRSMLQEKGIEAGVYPHVLVMSATPIPRTLALILYGDLDISIVDELPPGRTPVQTRLVPEEKRTGLYRFLQEEAAKGHQAYVVCPLVEDSDAMEDVHSAQATWEALTRHELKGLRVGLTWGAQPAQEKEQVLEQFSSGALDVLVSTTVIEVGVNVPNATVMVVENAERFGLSQLHQLRGRVGRGSAASWCFLLAEANSKLHILTQTNDGFLVAQKDLEIRGPGDLLGTRQSGESLRGFLLDGDVQLLDEAVRCMRELRTNPELKDEREAVEREADLHWRAKIGTLARN